MTKRTIIVLVLGLLLCAGSARAQWMSGGGANVSNATGPVGITGNQNNGGDFVKNVCVNGVCPATAFGASASGNTYTASTCTAIVAGSCTSGAGTLLLATAATDFKIGQYVAIPTAGQASPLTTTATAGAVTNVGTATGTDNVCYKITTGDPAEGVHDVTAVESKSTSPLPMAPDWLSNTAYTINVSYVMPQIGNKGGYVYLSTTGGTSNASTLTITAATEAQNIVTLTVTNTLAAGQGIVVAGVTPAGYNGSFQILTASGTNLTYYDPNAGLGAGSVFGTVVAEPVWPQTVANTVTDGSVTWTNEGPALSTQAGLSVAFTGNANANTVYLVYRDGPGVASCSGDPVGSYKFIGTANASPYVDYGADSPLAWDAPATPVTRNETAYCKITAVATSTNQNDTLTVDCTASQGQAAVINAASGVTIRHDETVAVQAAVDACPVGGCQIKFPQGTYHIDMVQNAGGGARSGYYFNGGNLGSQFSGMIQVNASNIRLSGDSTGSTIIINDWPFISNARDALFNPTPASMGGYIGPETSGGVARFTSYAINNALRGQYCVQAVTPANAGNFAVGDYAYTTGGGGVNSTYHINNISPVVSANASTGQICLRDALTYDLPYGVTGKTPYIEDLTTNNAVVSNVTFEDMTIKSPATIFSGSDVYDLLLQRLSVPTVPASAGSGGILGGQWYTRLMIRDSYLTFNFQETPVDSYITWDNDELRQMQPVQKLSFDGASAPAKMTNSRLYLACGSNLTLEQTYPELKILGNLIEDMCPTQAAASDSSALILLGNSAALPNGYDQEFSNNTVITNQKAILGIGNSAVAIIPNTQIANNTFTWYHGQTNSSGITVGSSAKVLGNKIYNIQIGPAVGNSAISYQVLTSTPGATLVGNTVLDVGAADLIGITVSDPGSVYTNPISILSNTFDGTFKGMSITSTTNTPKLALYNNIYKGSNAALNPTSLKWGVGCSHGLSAPSASNSYVINAGGTDCLSEWTGGASATPTVTFSAGYQLAPYCTCNNKSGTGTAHQCNVTTENAGSVVVTLGTSGDAFSLECFGDEERAN